MSDNPLSKLYRSKNIFISLPSDGRFYTSGISLSVDNELGIMPMTVKDEILLKSPDSLFNGEALVELIRSCVPDIKNPEEIPVCDIDSIILGIRASSNRMMELKSECPSCKTENDYNIDLLGYISTITKIPTDNTINANDSTVVELKPYTMKTLLKRKVQEYNLIKMEQRLRKQLKNSTDDIDDSALEQIKKTLSDGYNETTKTTIEIVAESILKVRLVDSNIEVNDRIHIFEWVMNMDKELYHKIVKKISELNDNNINKITSVSCPHCSTTYETSLELNPINFFTKEQS